jgi:hypothetical protein
MFSSISPCSLRRLRVLLEELRARVEEGDERLEPEDYGDSLPAQLLHSLQPL